MIEFVQPKTFLVGYTGVDYDGLTEYLAYTNNTEFLQDVESAKTAGLHPGEVLCSFYAKLCYRSLTVGQNSNVSKIRDIKSNLEGVVNSGHGSCLEHCNLNFVVTDVSRIETHEQVRHRAGQAVSQSSGRYIRLDSPLRMVLSPELEPYKDKIRDYLESTETLIRELEEDLKLNDSSVPFSYKKKVTSAIRRLAPNGLANELGFTLNLRALRHIIELRTSHHAEWEIRLVFNQVADIINSKWPTMLYGAAISTIDGLKEYKNLKV